MRILLIFLGISITTSQPTVAWSYNEVDDWLNGKMLVSCVEDRQIWNGKFAELCFVRIMKTNLVQIMLTLDRDDICDGEIRVAYQIDNGEINEWENMLLHNGSDSFVVFHWDWQRARSVANGKRILFRLGDSCENYYDYSFDIRGRPPKDVFCCY